MAKLSGDSTDNLQIADGGLSANFTPMEFRKAVESGSAPVVTFTTLPIVAGSSSQPPARYYGALERYFCLDIPAPVAMVVFDFVCPWDSLKTIQITCTENMEGDGAITIEGEFA